MGSRAIHDLVVAILRGDDTTAAQRQRTFAEPAERWYRVLGFEGCTVQFDRALHRAGAPSDLPPALRRLLHDASCTALQRALLVQRQLTEVAALSAAAGIRVMALKGAARLLAGELPGTRSIADIDLLVAPADAARLHELLRAEAGYAIDGDEYAHHLAGLTRRGSLGIEIHPRLTETPLPLDTMIWHETRVATLGSHAIELPSPTALFLHTLEHAARVNWTGRYRLRDILDIAGTFSSDVDASTVLAHVEASDCGRAMGTLLSAASALEARIPFRRNRAWRTVRRVGRTRLALAVGARNPRVAERWFRYAGVIAEGSPRNIGRLGFDLTRRVVTRATAAVALLLGVAACQEPAAPRPLVVTPFIFASDSAGVWSLYRFRDGAVSRISGEGSNDREPSVVGNRVVYTSLRDGDNEIYAATLTPDLTLAGETRLTNEYGTDAEPALSPSGATIAFVSARDGTPRIWLMDADGANQRALETGSAGYVPEQSPRWSPSGDRIAFTSTRSGTAQVHVVGVDGGMADQLSHETLGAFAPSWLPDGATILYGTTVGDGRIMSVPAGGGDARVFASDDAGLGEAACGADFCLAVSAPLGGHGRSVALRTDGQLSDVLLPQVADDHHPAPLAP